MPFVVNILMFLIKYAPTIEVACEYLYKDWEAIRENYDKQKAADTVKKAIDSANTKEINSILGKDE